MLSSSDRPKLPFCLVAKRLLMTVTRYIQSRKFLVSIIRFAMYSSYPEGVILGVMN